MLNIRFSKLEFWVLVTGYVGIYFILNLSQWGSHLNIWDIDIIALTSFGLLTLALVVWPILTMTLILPKHKFVKTEEKFLRFAGIALGSALLYGTVCKFIFVLALFNFHF